jgi:uncharacterized protein YggT (Ycf19 family)
MAVSQQPQQVPAQMAPVATPRYHFRAAAIIWFIAGIIDVFLVGDFIFWLLGAAKTSAFVNFVYQVAGIFSAPFHGIWPVAAGGDSYFDPADLVGIVVYAVICWGLVTLVKIATASKGTRPAV